MLRRASSAAAPFQLFCIALLLVSSLGAAGGPARAEVTDQVRVALEGGAIRPLGELGSDYDPEDLGLGAVDGYEVGFSLRLPIRASWTLSPGFHFVDYGRHVLVDDAEEEYRTEALSYRTTLEAMWSPQYGRNRIRPLLAVGGGLYRNRVVGFYDDPRSEERNDMVNTFGAYVRLGVRTENLEFSFLAHRNRVQTWRYFPGSTKGQYAWHALALRVGYLLPW